MRILFSVLCLLLFACPCVRAQNTAKKATPTIAEKVKGMELRPGYFPVYWSAKEGKVYVEISRFDEEFLYVNSLAAGLGSNDIGLDRNQLGQSRVVHFERIGPKVLLKQRNLDYRAVSDNEDEVNSVADAFAQSVLFGFKTVAVEGKRVLVDLTPMLMTDAHGVIQNLKRKKQGTYKIDGSRSAVYLDRTKNFPKNSEFEALLTFTGQATGSQLRSVTPTSGSFSLRMHHSFVELPDDNYEVRKFDPRSGYGASSYADYATPIDQPLIKRFIRRHRLEKKNPAAELSEPVDPIIYYLDRGAPEPIRSALLEGGRWWNQAFEAAGYKDAFRVEVLPEGADPLDVRYNVINWVHRSTRGWSYGSSVSDPRTGEIIKGHVLLGSLRVRQDFLIAQGLVAAYEEGEKADPRLEEMALARLRQLSAHEIGHTLGLSHNFAASVNDRASVMDYPHPYIKLVNGKVDFSEAYATGIGEWDKRTIMYGYQDFPAGVDETEELENILEESNRMGLFYVSDPDARPPGSAQPMAHLWDNGADPATELNRLAELREHALKNFGTNNIPGNTPLSELERVLVPVYLMHRYQVEAVSKQIGGYRYGYEVKGGYEATGSRPVDAEQQARAKAALLSTLDPEFLKLPPNLKGLIPPPALGYGRGREYFKSKNGGGLDPIAMAAEAAGNTLMFLTHHDRLARIHEQYALYPDQGFPHIHDYLGDIETAISGAAGQDEYTQTINQGNFTALIDNYLRIAANAKASNHIRGIVLEHLEALYDNRPSMDRHNHFRIKWFLENSTMKDPIPTPALPDGSPIGSCGFH